MNYELPGTSLQKAATWQMPHWPRCSAMAFWRCRAWALAAVFSWISTFTKRRRRTHWMQKKRVLLPRKMNCTKVNGTAWKVSTSNGQIISTVMLIQWTISISGPLSIATPGEVKGYWQLHKRFGSMPWKELIEPSIELCEEGFILTKHMADVLEPHLLNDTNFKYVAERNPLVFRGRYLTHFICAQEHLLQ